MVICITFFRPSDNNFCATDRIPPSLPPKIYKKGKKVAIQRMNRRGAKVSRLGAYRSNTLSSTVCQKNKKNNIYSTSYQFCSTLVRNIAVDQFVGYRLYYRQALYWVANLNNFFLISICQPVATFDEKDQQWGSTIVKDKFIYLVCGAFN